MMSQHFALSSELSGAIAKRFPHAKNQPSAPGSFFNQFITYIYIYIHIHIYINRVLIVRIVYGSKKGYLYIFTPLYSTYFHTICRILIIMLETSFQQSTWGSQGCRFRISYFQVSFIIDLFTIDT